MTNGQTVLLLCWVAILVISYGLYQLFKALDALAEKRNPKQDFEITGISLTTEENGTIVWKGRARPGDTITMKYETQKDGQENEGVH